MRRYFTTILLVAASSLCTAQDLINLPEGARTFVLEGVTVHTGAGQVLENASVAIKNGLIVEVGPGTAIKARVLELEGMHVYPGLIDALSHLGMPALPARRGTPERGFGPPAESASVASSKPYQSEGPGLYPHVAAASLLSEAFLEQAGEWRAQGVTSVHLAPSLGIFRGQSAVVNLGTVSPDQLIVRSPIALELSYSVQSSRQYPSSTMGVIAHIRQTWLDARHYGEVTKIYADHPQGLPRPQTDRGLTALQPFSRGRLPVIFPGNRVREIRRSLKMIKYFELKGVIAGGFEADQTTDELLEAGIPVLFSLNFPKVPRNQHPGTDESLAVLEYRVNAPGVPARLQNAGVRFALSSGDGDPVDFLKGLRRVVEQGLEQEQALRAATLSAAEILGVDRQLGSVEAGKIANLVVTTGDLFDAQTQIRYVFVDGEKFDLPERAAGERKESR